MFFLMICCAVIAILSIVLFSWGHKANRGGLTIAGFVLAIILVLGLAMAVFSPTKYETMRIVHINQTTNVITLIDNDGKAYYVDTDDTAHVGDFVVDSHAYVVKGGLLGDIKFVAPQQ